MSAETLSPQQYQVLAEPYVFALLTWPAAALVAHFDQTNQPGFRLAAILWLAIFHLAAYGRARGIVFGNILVLLSASVAVAKFTYPSVWAALEFPILLIGLYAAQRARLLKIAATSGQTDQSAHAPHT